MNVINLCGLLLVSSLGAVAVFMACAKFVRDARRRK
jgi:hypothetical protein